MILLVASSRAALPPVPVHSGFRRLILGVRRASGERALRAALRRGHYDAVISCGFAAAADERLSPGDLLLATRVYGSADLYIELPSGQTPGAISGSLATRLSANRRAPTKDYQRRLPVYAVDDSAFWVVRSAQAEGVSCTVLRAVLVSRVGSVYSPRLFDSGVVLEPLRLAAWLLRRRHGGVGALPVLLHDAAVCRARMAAALTVLTVFKDVDGGVSAETSF